MTVALTYGYSDTFRIEYAVKMDFIYTIKSINGNEITLKFVDNTVYSDETKVSTFKWVFKNPETGETLHTSTEQSCEFTTILRTSMDVWFTVTNIYGISHLNRTIYFNTYPTINALLNRTSTAISKEKDGNNYKLLSIDADEYDEIYASMMNLMKSGFVKTATGISLDYLAEMWKVYRNDGESDKSLRARLIQKITYETSEVTKPSLLNLIATAFGVSTSDVTLLEREEEPDYSWGTSVGGDDMKAYDATKRPAEFTFFVKKGPLNPVHMAYVTNLINEARACGVYFNSVKVTFIIENAITIDFSECTVYDEVILDGDSAWSIAAWGASDEELGHVDAPTYKEYPLEYKRIFTEIGDYVAIVATYGSETSDYAMREFSTIDETGIPYWDDGNPEKENDWGHVYGYKRSNAFWGSFEWNTTDDSGAWPRDEAL